MRKFHQSTLFLVILLLSIASVAFADNSMRSPSVDVVIVLDQSTSMNGTRFQSDPDGYRFDAAEIILALCDTNGARVAVVPFSESVESYADKAFVEISDEADRAQKINQIESIRRNTLNPNTDLGEALSTAVKMVLEREDTTNKPMIIVLTDGKNDFNDTDVNRKKNVFLWNGTVFESKQINHYDADDANRLVKNATRAAADSNIPIYTVALMPDPKNNEQKKFENGNLSAELESMARDTNGKPINLDSNNASHLPEAFGNMFAARIGSNLIVQLTTKDVGNGYYEVELPITNQSVMEANLYIPLEEGQIDPASIALFDAENANRTAGGKNVMRLHGKRFTHYKILSPRTLGNWRLRFKTPDGKAPSIAFSLLYNYSIVLQSRVGISGSELLTPEQSLRACKGDRLHVVSRFFEVADNGSVIPSADHHLYFTGDSWNSIKGTYELTDANHNVLSQGELTSDSMSQFSAEIDLANEVHQNTGVSMSAGTYYLCIKAEGAGLSRENILPITLTNQAPGLTDVNITQVLTQRDTLDIAGNVQASDTPVLPVDVTKGSDGLINLHITIPVNDPNDLASQQAQRIRIALPALFSDPDNDSLEFTLQAQTDSSSVLTCTVEKNADGTSNLVCQTVLENREENWYRTGQVQYLLKAVDKPDGDSTAFTLVLQAQGNEISEYQPATQVVQGIKNDQADKNASIHFMMTLNQNGRAIPNPEEVIDHFSGIINVYDANNPSGASLEKVQMTPTADHKHLEGTFTTGNIAKTYLLAFQYRYSTDGQRKTLKSEEITFDVLNTPPSVQPTIAAKLTSSIAFDPIPVFSAMLEPETSEKNRTFDLTSLFSDSDHETGLVFAEPVLSSSDGNAASRVQYHWNQDHTELTLLPLATGNVKLLLTATDGDGQSVSHTLDLTLYSLKQKWTLIIIIAILVLAALIALLCFIIHLCKPKFPSALLNVKKCESLQPDQICELIQDRKPRSLAYYIETDLANAVNISYDVLSSLVISPVRNNPEALYIKRTSKKAVTFSAVISDGTNGTNKLTSKNSLWPMGADLVLQSDGSPDYLCISLNHADNFNADLPNQNDVFSYASATDNQPQDTAGTDGLSW
ncbi:MAG: vWA domain-containing protein [Clostridia bacterium]